MTKDIENFIQYLHDVKQTSKNTELSYERDLRKMSVFLQEQGVRVPEDVSVVGFDDSPWCEKVSPALTTVKQDPARRARLAVEILQELKKGGYSRTTVKIPVQLVERDSVKRLEG